MQSIAWWPSVAVLLVAAGIDLRTRRIPNWLVVPFLISGLAIRAVTGGLGGAAFSVTGLGLALLLFALPCSTRGMGMGDLKLAAGVGAWIGPGQFWMAFILTGIVGGVMAAGYALRYRSPDSRKVSPHDEAIRRGRSGADSIPYAPAIAIGTLFSFFTQ